MNTTPRRIMVWVMFLLIGLSLNTAAPAQGLRGNEIEATDNSGSATLTGISVPYVSPSATRAVPTGATFTITWSSDCLNPPAEAVTALEYAAGLWGTWISSSVPVAVSACWTPNLGDGDALATGTPTGYYANFSGAPLVDVQYPAALANALHGADLNPVRGDMTLQFKSDVAWSYATARSLTAGEDFVAVALHELAHGLGFAGNMYADYGVGFCGNSLYGALYPCPTPYDWFAVDSSGVALLDYLNDPDDGPYKLAARLTGDANFGGPNALAARGGPVKLYTPTQWRWGSSLSHLDQETFQATANRLMTPSYSGVTRHPGAVTLAMLQDMGWRRADALNVIVTERGGTAGRASTWRAAVVGPGYNGESLTYTWSATDLTPLVHTARGATDTATFLWTTPGLKRVTVTVAGLGTPFSAVYTVRVGYPVYLPLALKASPHR